MELKKIKIEHSFGVSELTINENREVIGNGQITYSDGRRYNGQVDLKGLPSGEGVFTFSNNDTLEGKFRENGSLIGIGKYRSSKESEFENGHCERIFL